MTIAVNVSSALAIASKDDLKAYMADEIDRDLTDPTPSGTLSDSFDKWILMAEARFDRDLRCPQMERTVTGTVTAQDTPLPDDYIAMRAIYDSSTPNQPLRAVAPSEVRQEYDGTPGPPQAFTLVSGGLRLIPPPDNAYLLTMDYYGKIDRLSVLAPSNWLLADHPDAYVLGTLFHYYRWSKDRQSAEDCQILSQQVIDKINTAARLDRYGSGPLARATVPQVAGSRC